jgi:hypothetical protein
MQTVAIISIISILAWFIMGVSRSVNLNNFTEDELRD